MMFFWWIVPLLLVFAFTDRRPEGSGVRGGRAAAWVLALLGIFVLGGVGMMGYGHMGGWGGYGGYGGWNWMGMIFNLVLIGALIFGAYALFRRSGSGAASESDEIRVLKLRLAKGEITTEEYDLLMQKLKG